MKRGLLIGLTLAMAVFWLVLFFVAQGAFLVLRLNIERILVVVLVFAALVAVGMLTLRYKGKLW